MNEDVVKFLYEKYNCRSLGKDTYHITLPLFYPNTDTQLVVGAQFNGNQLILSDLGEFVTKVYEVNPKYFLEDKTKDILKKYEAEYDSGKITMERLTFDIQTALSEFMFLLVVLIDSITK